MGFRKKLIEHTRRDVKRLDDMNERRVNWGAVFLYGSTLGLLFVVPIVFGVYLGRWLDNLVAGYSVRWTVSLLVLGIAVGSYNVFRFVREKL
jgi:ATP synthase protein I